MFLPNDYLCRVLLAVSLLAAGPAFAVTSVGPEPCDFPAIQSAIDAVLEAQRAGDLSDPDIIVAGGRYNESLIIDATGIAGARLSISGGFDAACNVLDPEAATVLDADGEPGSAMKISGSIAIQLTSLMITGANTTTHGGGIDFNGAGSLDLTNTAIVENHASYGGGIFANGFPPLLTIRLHRNNIIAGNSAAHAGGGIHLSSETRLFMLDGDTSIVDNAVDATDANGAGGGLQIVGPARADIGSGIISGNTSRNGGGISVSTAGNESGHLRFFRTRASHPTRIEFNSAADTGGGIHVNGGFPRGVACGFGYQINGNTAQEGSAIHVDSVPSEMGGQLLLTQDSIDSPDCGPETAASLGALQCTVGSSCNAINENRAETLSGSATAGATVLVGSDAFYTAGQLEMRRNEGGNILEGSATLNEGELSLSNCLIADNAVSGDLMRVEEGGKLNLRSCTLSGNDMGGPVVLSLTGDLALNESLVWQPGKTILDQVDGHQRDVRNVLASEIASLVVQDDVIALDPQFVAPASGNYSLLPASPALDFASALPGNDLDGSPRTVDLPLINRPGGGALDLGAYELQSLPLFPPGETFDEVTAPVLPPVWTNNHVGAGPGWITAAEAALSAPNAAYTDDTGTVTDKSLETPPFNVVADGRLAFRQKVDLEYSGDATGLDGVVLEIAIFPEPFVDILSAGGSFVTGAYGHTIGACCDNPLAGREAWSGTSNGYQTVVVKLPEAANGHSVRLRWRMGTDYSVGRTGYWLDDIRVNVDESIFSNGFDCIGVLCAL